MNRLELAQELHYWMKRVQVSNLSDAEWRQFQRIGYKITRIIEEKDVEAERPEATRSRSDTT